MLLKRIGDSQRVRQADTELLLFVLRAPGVDLPDRLLCVLLRVLPGDYLLFAAGWMRQLEPAEWHPIQDYDLLPIETIGPERLG